MGESNRHRAQFFSRHPHCCFCAGKSESAEIEHIPPRTMFLNKHRPAGFEFPTCVACNRASRKTDTVVSFLAKFGSFNNYSEVYSAEFEKSAKAIFRYCPETYEEIINGRVGNRRKEKALRNIYGDEVVLVSLGSKQREHINLFGLKLTVATYYEVTGNIASENARINVVIHTSTNAAENTLPTSLNFLGELRAMNQGSWSVGDQFSYRYGVTENRKTAVFQFLLHNNLLLSTFIFDDPEHAELTGSLHETFSVGCSYYRHSSESVSSIQFFATIIYQRVGPGNQSDPLTSKI